MKKRKRKEKKKKKRKEKKNEKKKKPAFGSLCVRTSKINIAKLKTSALKS